MKPESPETCLAIVHQGVKDLKRGDLTSADRLFGFALAAVPALPREHAYSLFPLTVCYLALLRHRQGKSDDSAQLRGMAVTGLDAIDTPMQDGLFHGLMADALMELQEYRRAVLFYENTALAFSEANDPLGIAGALCRAGQCYNRAGLKDHAVIPLRAAVRIYRDHPGDPRLPIALLNLGIALSKSSPAEAEQAYLEAAGFYTAKMQLESAAPAWVNLGVLCAKQDRNAEALAWYQKALRVRERSASPAPTRIATLLNNIANCLRRSGEFAPAHDLLDRAVRLLNPGEHQSIASVYGTRGLIFRDQGRDLEAVEWLQRSFAERQKMPSPNLDDLATDLEYEIAILERLGLPEETAAAQARLAATRAAQSSVPHASFNLASGTEDTEGAVLIELDCSNAPVTRHSVSDAIRLAEQLSAAAQNHLAGLYRGRVMIPESTTLMFYGPDAEELYHALEPILETDPVCEGARISIRQGSHLREIGMPIQVM
jgi:tetratricopeptide (TPR) repeat protein